MANKEYPKIGSKWIHNKTGSAYEVVRMANTGSDRPTFPDTIVYACIRDGEVYAKEYTEDGWRRKMRPLEDSL